MCLSKVSSLKFRDCRWLSYLCFSRLLNYKLLLLFNCLTLIMSSLYYTIWFFYWWRLYWSYHCSHRLGFEQRFIVIAFVIIPHHLIDKDYKNILHKFIHFVLYRNYLLSKNWRSAAYTNEIKVKTKTTLSITF